MRSYLRHKKKSFRDERGIMNKTRIIKRTFVNKVTYVIQQKHFLFRWMWVDAWVNSANGAACQDAFYTLEEAQANLCYFDGRKAADEVVMQPV